MISVAEAVQRVAGAFAPLGEECVPLNIAVGRVLAADVVAQYDHPPAPVSAMDGYAVNAASATVGAKLSVIGHAPAGHPFDGRVRGGETVRIFTGGVVPEGANAVVMQEDTGLTNGAILIEQQPAQGENIRPRGLDFRAGELLLTKGHRLSPRDVALIAAADWPNVRVTRKPRIAIAATGDELSRPGQVRRDGGIVASSTYGLQAMVAQWGGEAIDMGILPDTMEAFSHLTKNTDDVDLIITLGGASVGDHDLVRSALTPHGFHLDFWKIAMRPGKPLIFGYLRQTPLLGLPGNPVSAMVCSILFLAPAIAGMLGTPYSAPITKGILGSPVKANGKRQDYLRARLVKKDGLAIAYPFPLQDSSMQKIFAHAECLIIRVVGAPAANAGDEVEIYLLHDT